MRALACALAACGSQRPRALCFAFVRFRPVLKALAFFACRCHPAHRRPLLAQVRHLAGRAVQRPGRERRGAQGRARLKVTHQRVTFFSSSPSTGAYSASHVPDASSCDASPVARRCLPGIRTKFIVRSTSTRRRTTQRAHTQPRSHAVCVLQPRAQGRRASRCVSPPPLQLAHVACAHLGAQLVNLGSGLTTRACCCAQGTAAAMAESSDSDGAMAGAARARRVLPRRPGELTAALVCSTPWAPAQARLRARAGRQRRAGPEAACALGPPLRGYVGRKAHGHVCGGGRRRQRGALAFRRRQRPPSALAPQFGARAGGSQSCAPRGAAGCA